jgi:hypothetical protein
MSQNSFPVFADQGGLLLHAFAIDGSAVTTSFSGDGLDGRGRMLADIKDAAAVQTVLFKQAMTNAYIFLQALTDNGAANMALTTSGSKVTGFTLTGVERDDNTTPLADQDWFVQVYEYSTTQFVQ